MRQVLIFFIGVFFCTVKAQVWQTEDQYIQVFAPYAVEEMELYKIPASITLAQGLLETAGGQSFLAREGKNHFGIKCKEEWTGKTITYTDDAPDECFRAYATEKDSYRDHSIFLTTRKHYSPLFLLDIKDYKGWAYGLKKAGYATAVHYPISLIKKIEKYKLYKFDGTDIHRVNEVLLSMYPELPNDREFIAMRDRVQNPQRIPEENNSYVDTRKEIPLPKNVSDETPLLDNILIKNHSNGGLKFVVLPEDTDLSEVSNKFGISERRLKRYNDLETYKLKKNQIIFLEAKKSSGDQSQYIAKSGESMYDISQKFAVKLRKLYRKNRMEFGEEVKEGQVIYLDSRKPRD